MAALFTIAKTWKQPKCPPTDQWRSKLWSIQTMEDHSILKRKEIMQYAVTWMKLVDIILGEISQTQRDK